MPGWLPDREADRLVWLQNFALKLNTYVGTAGIIAADVTSINLVRDQYQWILNRVEQIRSVSQDLTAFKSINASGPVGTPIGAYPVAPIYPAPPLGVPNVAIFDLVVTYAERVKNTVGYNVAMGEDLGIVGPVSIASLGDPTFTALSQPGSEMRLNWVKATSDGVVIEGQRNSENVWILLGTDRFSPFLDARPPLVAGTPELRRYRMRYLSGDDLVGNYSATVEVTTVP